MPPLNEGVGAPRWRAFGCRVARPLCACMCHRFPGNRIPLGKNKKKPVETKEKDAERGKSSNTGCIYIGDRSLRVKLIFSALNFLLNTFMSC